MALILIFLFQTFFIGMNSKYLYSVYRKKAELNLKEDAILVSALAEQYSAASYHKVFENSKLRFTLIGTDGKVLYDSRKYLSEKDLENHLLRPEVQQALKEGSGFSVRESSTLGETMAYYTTLIKNKEGQEVIVRTARNYSEEMNILINIILAQIFFFLILDYFIHFFYKNYLKRDLMNKIERIRLFLESQGSVRGNYLKEDKWLLEFWRIVKEWQDNNLKNIRRLARDKRVQNLIINSVDMAILLFDEKLNLKTKNKFLDTLFESNKKSYLEVIKHIEIINVFKKGLGRKDVGIKEEVYIPNLKKYFLINFKFLQEDKVYLLTVKDITGSREMVEVQKKFISNISHELKTPLTNIKGYLIALEDAPDPLRKNFLGIVKSNVEKLENIVSDFLSISKMESFNILNISEVKFEKVKENIEASLKGILEKKQGQINFDLKLLDEEDYIRVDYDKFMLILKNLIENALIYNKSEKPVVDVEVIEAEDKYQVRVKDNGIGIPDEEVEKIFDRFYRVDKARTSNVAGTGLGLAIVKEVVEKCGGSIYVCSQEGVGTEFTFTVEK